MTVNRVFRGFVGFMVLLSVALGYFFSPWWYLLTVFVGLNLFQSAFTDFCPATIILKKLGVKSGESGGDVSSSTTG